MKLFFQSEISPNNRFNPPQLPYQFEYVFYFLFRTFLWTEGGYRWNEPAALSENKAKQVVRENGIRFEADKRLFRQDIPPGESLDKWETHLKRAWYDISQVYVKSFGHQKKAWEYCQKALLGVSLLILDDSDTVAHHTVHISVQDQENPILRFIKLHSDPALFSIRTEAINLTARFHAFVPVTQAGQPFLQHRQLRLGQPNDQTLPHLAKQETNELAPNPVFSVYAFAYGGDITGWKDSIVKLLIWKGPFNRQPLLSTVFVRLMIGQWQFERIDETANQFTCLLQRKNAYYEHEAYQYHNLSLHCLSFHKVKKQWHEIQLLNNDAVFLTHRLQAALKNLEINGIYLATRLEQLRQEAEQVNWQLHFQPENRTEPINWKTSQDNKISLLIPFHLKIEKLQIHDTEIKNQIHWLQIWQERWSIYWQQRQMNQRPYLERLAPLLTLLLVTHSLLILGLNENPLKRHWDDKLFYFTFIVLLIIPLLWHFIQGLVQRFYCFSRKIGINAFFHQNVIKIINKFHWFKPK